MGVACSATAPPKLRGRPRADDRRTINGILWVLRSGARWRDLPKEFGSSSTCHRRLQEWQEQGVWEHIWLTFLGTLDQQGKLYWSQAFLDGSFVPAKKGERTLPMAGRARAARSTW
ncbi:MAG TPA: transposase [Dehalococcoidia bacterium]|jgi:transposase|nr:transposase [Dehalococcoidia bacterium]